jgi:hypothetical protein
MCAGKNGAAVVGGGEATASVCCASLANRDTEFLQAQLQSYHSLISSFLLTLSQRKFLLDEADIARMTQPPRQLQLQQQPPGANAASAP